MRSHPSHLDSPSFQIRRRCRRRNRGPAGRGAIAQIESRNPFGRDSDQGFVAVRVFARGVGPIGHEREMHIAFRAREVMNLEAFDQLFYAVRARQQGGNGDQRAEIGGHAVNQVERRQKRRRKAGVDSAIDERHRSVNGRNGAERAEEDESGKADAGSEQRDAAARREGPRRRRKWPSHSR